mmetsp:Transcript_33091/g.65510  ORF Transcript_33091/g.65510 Transcript_33091/m.65510 type:complete len:257 (+) Transcript_33091:641-1411(+)
MRWTGDPRGCRAAACGHRFVPRWLLAHGPQARAAVEPADDQLRRDGNRRHRGARREPLARPVVALVRARAPGIVRALAGLAHRPGPGHRAELRRVYDAGALLAQHAHVRRGAARREARASGPRVLGRCASGASVGARFVRSRDPRLLAHAVLPVGPPRPDPRARLRPELRRAHVPVVLDGNCGPSVRVPASRRRGFGRGRHAPSPPPHLRLCRRRVRRAYRCRGRARLREDRGRRTPAARAIAPALSALTRPRARV